MGLPDTYNVSPVEFEQRQPQLLKSVQGTRVDSITGPQVNAAVRESRAKLVPRVAMTFVADCDDQSCTQSSVTPYQCFRHRLTAFRLTPCSVMC